MPRLRPLLRCLGPVAGILAVVLTAWSCGQSPSAPGMGSLSVFMAFDNGFTAASPLPGIAPLSDDDALWGDRTPLADLIVTFDLVEAWSCADDDTSMDDEEDDEDDEEDDEEEDDSIRLQPLHGGDGDDDDHTGWDDDCESFVVMTDNLVTLSVTELDTTLSALLAGSELPVGDYEFLTLGIVEAIVVTEAGDSVLAKVPSGRIKVKSPFSISEGGSTEILIVFDVNRSVVETPPGSLNFIVKPVLHSQVGWNGHDDDEDEDDDDDDEEEEED